MESDWSHRPCPFFYLFFNQQKKNRKKLTVQMVAWGGVCVLVVTQMVVVCVCVREVEGGKTILNTTQISFKCKQNI